MDDPLTSISGQGDCEEKNVEEFPGDLEDKRSASGDFEKASRGEETARTADLESDR